MTHLEQIAGLLDKLDACEKERDALKAANLLLKSACERALKIEEAHLKDIREAWGEDVDSSPDYAAAIGNAQCYRSALAKHAPKLCACIALIGLHFGNPLATAPCSNTRQTGALAAPAPFSCPMAKPARGMATSPRA